MFYLISWTALIAATVLFSLVTFFWALRNGQFEEQERARFMPLIDLPPPEKPLSFKRRPIELYVLSIGVISVGAALVACVLLGMQVL
jgi:cbb3-type cytochrome oxidase maturation protein